MLGVWRNNADYQSFMIRAVNKEFKSNPKSIQNHEAAFLKMHYLNIDNIKEDFLPLFSITGRPSNQQPEIFRSFLLMSHYKFADIDEWVAHASSTPVLCALAGVTSDNFPGASQLSDKGIPICADGHEMLNWGFDWRKYRIKYRCPMITGKVKSCPYCQTLYGKTIYFRLASNIRLLTPIPRDSLEWVENYNLPTASERANNRILTDYELERPKRYGKTKLVSFAFFNAINVRLDALIKFGTASIQTLIA